MTPSTDLTDLQSQVESINESMSRVQQTIRQLQNATATGVGSTTPARTRGGITVPPVSAVKAKVGTSVVGETQLSVSWVDAPQPTGASIDHYNVYATNAFSGQTQPTLIGATKASPFVGAFQPSSNVSVTIVVQTVLSNGQSLRLGDCPTTALQASKPATSVLNLLQGFIYQQPARINVATIPGNGIVNLLTTSNATGGALLAVEVTPTLSGFFLVGSQAYGLRMTMDGVAGPSVDFANLGPGPAAGGNNTYVPLGLGFATSCVVDVVTSAGAVSSGFFSMNLGFALHT